MRSYLADECQLSFIKFERSWLPVELHLELWRRQHALHTERMRLEAIAAFQDDDGDGSDADDDLIMLTPPNHGSAAAVQPASSSSSSAPSSGSSSANSSPVAHYTPSHIAKRRVIQGSPYFVVIWNKTTSGYKEIATLPKQMHVDAPSAAPANATHDDDDEEIDMTSVEAASSPVVTNTAASATSALAASKRQPVQDVDLALYETYEPAWFVLESLPQLVARFESEETAEAQRKVQAKEQAKADKAALRASKPARSDSGAAAKAPAKPRGRPKKLVADPHTPSIASFLSPIPTASKEADPVPMSAAATLTAACKDDANFGCKQQHASHAASPPLNSVIPAAADGSHPAIHISQSSALSKMAVAAPNLFASLMRSTQADTAAANASNASVSITVTSCASVRSSKGVVLKSQQSSMHTFVKASKITSNTRQPPPHKLLSKHDNDVVQAPPPSILPAVKCFSVAHDADLSPSSPPLGSRPSSPLLSSLLSTCPMCGSGFPSRLLQSHVNACLDEQQQREDERMATELQQAVDKPTHSTAAKRMHDQLVDNDAHAASIDRAASRSRVASSPSSPTASDRSSSHSLTPQKRKKHVSSRRAVSPTEEIDLLSPEAVMPPRARHAAAPLTASASAPKAKSTAPPPPSTSSRTLIDLMDSDDDCDDKLQQLLDDMSDDEDEQPGSLIYCSRTAAAARCALSSAH